MNKKNFMTQENNSVNRIADIVELTDEDLQQIAGGPSRVDVNALKPIVGGWKGFDHTVKEKNNLQMLKQFVGIYKDANITGMDDWYKHNT